MFIFGNDCGVVIRVYKIVKSAFKMGMFYCI